MARLNIHARNMRFTHEGAPAVPMLSPEKQLRRLVLACLLWEDQFYVDGKTIAEQIVSAAEQVDPRVLAELAIEARTVYSLRHVPLLLLDVLSKTGPINDPGLVASTVDLTIQRVDDMAELLAIYWRDGHKMLSHGLRKGLARAIRKFNEYQLAKYDRDGKVKLRDVLRVARPKPDTAYQSALWKRVVKRELQTPDTWEVELSAGKDKKATFERLLSEKKLGYLALLRNLRNMHEAGVDFRLVWDAILARKGGAERVFPFRYVAAARAAPMFERELDAALSAAIGELPILKGRTTVLVDVSGSMNDRLSNKSDMTKMDAAAALAAIINAENLRVFTFSAYTVEVPARRGMAGVDVVVGSQPHSMTNLGDAMAKMNSLKQERLIVITDEQSHQMVPNPAAARAYMINVASYQNGIGYGGGWTHIDGFSESVLRYIYEVERAE